MKYSKDIQLIGIYFDFFKFLLGGFIYIILVIYIRCVQKIFKQYKNGTVV